MTPNARIAEATLAHLVGLGVKDCVVCAGARNVPLVGSLLRIAEKHGITLWHHFDERTAAFFALGLAKDGDGFVAVLTTSGTAVAEMLPATIEAYYSGVPIILVSADRPACFRGSGAPQAIEQVGLFGPYAPKRIDVQEVTDLSWLVSWQRDSPLHLNVCFEEPTREDAVAEISPVEMPRPSREEEGGDGVRFEAFVANPTRLLVLLGELPLSWREPVEDFLARIEVPFWAEATSGLRESSRLAAHRVARERDLGSLHPKKVLRIGGVPSLRFWRDLETHAGIEVMSVSPQPFSGLARSSRHLACPYFPTPPELPHTGPIRQGQVAESTLLDPEWFSDERTTAALDSFPGSEPGMIRELSERIPEEALVFLGNSLPIREWNLAASFRKPHRRVIASRGANGIDGQIATFLGRSRSEEESWGVFGDLTALYDLNAPAILSQLPPGLRRIVVVNNGGGRIFSRLPSMSGMTAEEKTVTENRHAFRFDSWAAMWKMGHATWSPGEDFPDLEEDCSVLEILPSEDATESFWSAWK